MFALAPLIFMCCSTHAQGWGTDDYSTLFNEIFLNAIMGWTLGTGYYVRGAYFEAMASTCGFEPGEFYVVVFEPQVGWLAGSRDF